MKKDPVKINKVSQNRYLNINKLIKEHFSLNSENEINGTMDIKKQVYDKIEFSQMSDIQKTQFFLGNQTRLQDTEEFINEFKSFEEPTVDNPQV